MYFESKFVALENQLELVQSFLDTHLSNSDPFPEDEVWNLYFDTYDVRSAMQAFSDDSFKKKYRVRLYSSTQQLSLQIKIKEDGATLKHKVRLPHLSPSQAFRASDWETLVKAIPDSDPQKGLFVSDSLQKNPLYPFAMVKYVRRRYRIGDHRITWDTGLQYKASQYFTFNHQQAHPSHGILEIKSTLQFIPPFLTSGFGLNLHQTNISKFKSALTSLGMIHPPLKGLERNPYGFKSVI